MKSVYQPAGTLNHRQHFYYNEDWQALEVRKETSGSEDPDPLEQFVYHPYYIDAVLCRFYDDNEVLRINSLHMGPVKRLASQARI